MGGPYLAPGLILRGKVGGWGDCGGGGESGPAHGREILHEPVGVGKNRLVAPGKERSSLSISQPLGVEGDARAGPPRSLFEELSEFTQVRGAIKRRLGERQKSPPPSWEP